jgi:hypothetical protein
MIGFHATHVDAIEVILAEGLRVDQAQLGCKHVCFAETAESAKYTMQVVRGIPGASIRVLQVDVTGLGVDDFIGGEARVHDDVSPDRITLLDRDIIAQRDGWFDPFYAFPSVGNHPHCWHRSPRGLEALAAGVSTEPQPYDRETFDWGNVPNREPG